MITLYNHPMSPCAQKVRIALAEKNLPYESRFVDLAAKENLQPWYLEMNPIGVVPTLVDNGEPVIESSLVCEYIEEAYPDGITLRPDSPVLRAKMRVWMKHVDNKLHPSCGALQWPLAMRPRLLEMSEEDAMALIEQVPEAPRRERQKRLYAHGLEASDVQGAVKVYCETIDKMEADMQNHTWVLSDEFSLVDIVLAPYFQTLMQYHWTELYTRSHPKVTDWVARVVARDSWKPAILDEFSPDRMAELGQRGEEAWPIIAKHAGLA